MLSKKTKYALHALVFLDKHKDQGPVQIAQISDDTGISRKFLENILLELRKAGVLGSRLGKGGGYYLMKDAEDIPLSQVIRMFTGPIAMLPCASLNYYEKCQVCKDETTCGLHRVMIDVRDQTLQILEGKSIADIRDEEIA